MSKLTKKQALGGELKIWKFLTLNPMMNPWDWNGWRLNGGKIPYCENTSFACEYNKQNGNIFCNDGKCIIPLNSKDCCCTCPHFSHYADWYNEKDKIKRSMKAQLFVDSITEELERI